MMPQFQKKKYKWLSNFVSLEIELDRMKYPLVEHVFNSAKSDDAEWKIFCFNPISRAEKIKSKR